MNWSQIDNPFRHAVVCTRGAALPIVSAPALMSLRVGSMAPVAAEQASLARFAAPVVH